MLSTYWSSVYLFFSFQSYILPNQPINETTPLHMFQVPVETIEKASGLIFFDKVPRHAINQIRPTITLSSWRWPVFGEYSGHDGFWVVMLVSQKVSCGGRGRRPKWNSGKKIVFGKSARFNSETSVPASHFWDGYRDSKKGFRGHPPLESFKIEVLGYGISGILRLSHCVIKSHVFLNLEGSTKPPTPHPPD